MMRVIADRSESCSGDCQALGRGAAVVLRKPYAIYHLIISTHVHGHSRECLFDISINFYFYYRSKRMDYCDDKRQWKQERAVVILF